MKKLSIKYEFLLFFVIIIFKAHIVTTLEQNLSNLTLKSQTLSINVQRKVCLHIYLCLFFYSFIFIFKG
jgi:hypothetical protein